MKCADARKHLGAFALGDLDAEPARELDEHLKQCAECRRERDAMGSAVAMLKGIPPVGSSAERREAAVAGMAREQAVRFDRQWKRPRRGLRRWAVAGILAVLVAGAALVWPRGRWELQVVQVNGRGEVYHAASGLWTSLVPGDRVCLGDRVVTQGETVVVFGLGAGRLSADQNTSFVLAKDRRVVLDRGRLCADLSESGLVVSDTANNYVSVDRGLCEAGMRETYAFVAGAAAVRPASDPQAIVKIEDLGFAEAAAEISRRTSRTLVVSNTDTARHKVSFYSRLQGGSALYEEFVRSMEQQNVAIVNDRAILSVPASRQDASRRLFARVGSGEALLEGSHQQRRQMAAGEEGCFDLGGRPDTTASSTEVAAWSRPGFYDRLARNRVLLGAPLAFRVAGRDEKGTPLVRCRIEDSECLVRIGDVEGTVKLVQADIDRLAADGSEVVIPLKFKFDVKK